MRFTYELSVNQDLAAIEPDPRHQCEVMEIVETACLNRPGKKNGIGFVRILWKREWLVWYNAVGGEISVLSIRPDLT